MQGAEAIVTVEDDKVIKKRVPKEYRHPTLDKQLRVSRARREKKMLQKAAELIPVPKVEFGDDETVVMQHIDGPMLKEVLEDNINLAQTIGEQVGLLHKHNMIHGDLTTSNMLYKEKVYFIDFGLSFTSTKDEDKAVDIHLFKQALESKHHTIALDAFELFKKGYLSTNNSPQVFDRLQEVELRGRHKNK